MLYRHIGWHPQLIYIDIPKYKSINPYIITTWFINFHHHLFAVVVWVCSLKEKINTNHRGIARGLFTTIGNHSGPLVKPSGLFSRVVVNAEMKKIGGKSLPWRFWKNSIQIEREGGLTVKVFGCFGPGACFLILHIFFGGAEWKNHEVCRRGFSAFFFLKISSQTGDMMWCDIWPFWRPSGKASEVVRSCRERVVTY